MRLRGGHPRQGLGEHREARLGLPRLAIGLRQQGQPVGAQDSWSHPVRRRQPLTDVRHACGHVSPHSQGPAAQHAPLFETQRKALCLGQGHHGVGVCLRRRHVSAALGQDGGTELCIRQAGGMLQLPGQGQRLLTPLPGLVPIAQPPQDLRDPGED